MYSLKATSDSIKQDLDEYNEQLPNNGTLEDLINQVKKQEKKYEKYHEIIRK